MPLNKKGKKIMKAMKDQYGEKEGIETALFPAVNVDVAYFLVSS